jgi:hypothetical protein
MCINNNNNTVINKNYRNSQTNHIPVDVQLYFSVIWLSMASSSYTVATVPTFRATDSRSLHPSLWGLYVWILKSFADTQSRYSFISVNSSSWTSVERNVKVARCSSYRQKQSLRWFIPVVSVYVAECSRTQHYSATQLGYQFLFMSLNAVAHSTTAQLN